MSDFAVLREMMQDAAVLPMVDSHGQKEVQLTEAQYPTSEITIAGLPQETVVIRSDTFVPPKAVFQDSMGECKRADFVVIANAGNKKVILCIEMKAGKGGPEKEIIQQLKGAYCFVVYCREIGRSFWDMPDFLADYRYRFISIREVSISKRPTRFDTRLDAHDRPDQMLKITGQKRLQFNHLVGRER